MLTKAQVRQRFRVFIVFLIAIAAISVVSCSPTSISVTGLSGAKGKICLTGKDLGAWRTNRGNWETVGGVHINPENEKQLLSRPGRGIITNGPGGKTRDIFSKQEFADVMVHLEFMVPHRSNSGVYLMGQYEIQVFDSWGREKLKYGDNGGIYQRWDENREPKGYQGTAPKVNASLEAGKWQSFDIVFRAPRFDKDGGKTANAKFEKIVHNGVLIHENVELTGPTRGSMYPVDIPYGPLRIQGDHGSAAYRNIRIVPL